MIVKLPSCVALAACAAALVSCSSSPAADEYETPDSVVQCQEALAQLRIEGSVVITSDAGLGYPSDSTICGYQTPDGLIHNLLVFSDGSSQFLPDTPGANPEPTGE